MRRLFKIVAALLGLMVLLILVLLAPVGYVEAFCHGKAEADTYKPLISDDDFRRKEANTYLTYPEWHIVYAYDGLAEVLKTGDEYKFDYAGSVMDFWSSTCALTKIADRHGGADSATRLTIHTIGVSFSLEMTLKAAYEETIGRVTAAWRGSQKTPQDLVAMTMAADYAAFLRQTPWYKYPFQPQIDKLHAAPIGEPVRSYERRFALGTEWQAKIAYASAIANAVAATGEAQLTIRSIITGLSASTLAEMPDVTVVSGDEAQGIVIETPRYDRFTHILADIAQAGGTIREIAGNDDIMLSMTMPPASATDAPLPGQIISRIPRRGFGNERVLVSVKVGDLAAILKTMPIADPGIEHVFDY